MTLLYLTFNTERGGWCCSGARFDEVRVRTGSCSCRFRVFDETVQSVHGRRSRSPSSVGMVTMRHLRRRRLLRCFLLASLLADLRARSFATDTCRRRS